MFPNPQDALPLPAQPNLEQYKKLAKDLLKAATRDADSAGNDAFDSWADNWVQSLFRLSGLTITPGMPVHVGRWAREVAGFARQKLLTGQKPTLADAQFVIARSHGFPSWPKFSHYLQALANGSSIESRFESAADAIVNGDLATLRRLLREDPSLVHVRSTRDHQATLLHYVSANGVEGYRQKTPKNIVAVAELLIQSGAQVDAECDVYGGGATTLGLTGTSIHPERAGVQAELMQLLIDYGALVNHRTSAGNQQDAVIGSLSNDRPAAASFLASRGANLNLESAAGVGRLDVVKTYFNNDGTLKSGTSMEELQRGFIWACEYGHKDVVEFLVSRSADVRKGDGQTPLHLAAHRGQLEIMKLLLARGAELEVKNEYGGTILGQTTWSVMNGDPNIDFVPVVQFLLDQGANVEEADYPTGNAQIDEILKSHYMKTREEKEKG